jgi:hypothetical protein
LTAFNDEASTEFSFAAAAAEEILSMTSENTATATSFSLRGMEIV